MIARCFDRDSLVAALDRGHAARMILFWGHTGKPGTVGPFVLSQWRAAPFSVDGVRYPTAEHYMMAEKARLFHDGDALARILAAPEPGAAKALGRLIRGFDPVVWERHRFDIVVAGSHAKFSQNADLLHYLLATRDHVLVEASPTDRIWGVGLARNDARIGDPRQWLGENLLGFALMKARALLSPD